MRFSKLTRLRDMPEVFNRSPRRMAAAKRAVQRDMDMNALTPELVKHQSADERLDSRERGLIAWNREKRQQRAKEWLEARRRLRAMPEPTRGKLLEYWQTCKYPGDPGYLTSLIRTAECGEFDPEARLRELAELREGGWIWRKTGVSLTRLREERGQRWTA